MEFPFKRQIAGIAAAASLFGAAACGGKNEKPDRFPPELPPTPVTEAEANTMTFDELSEKYDALDPVIKFRDADIEARGNKALIAEHQIKMRQQIVEINKLKFIINIYYKEGAPTNAPRYLVLHDSENVAFDTALRAITKGGVLVALDNRETRNLYSAGAKPLPTWQDPNRMFNPANKYWPVAKKILELLNASQQNPLISLHNNVGVGYRMPQLKHRKNVFIQSDRDKDGNMVWIPGSSAFLSPELLAEIQKYRDQGLNVVYEDAPKLIEGDGSLSVYSANNDIPYRNVEIETQPGKHAENMQTQKKYLAAVLQQFIKPQKTTA